MVVNSLIIRGRDQVMLKVTVAEIDRNIAKQLGLTSSTWGPFTQYNPFGINGNIATSPTGQTSGITLSQSVEHRVGDAAGVRALWRLRIFWPNRPSRPFRARAPISRSAANFRSPVRRRPAPARSRRPPVCSGGAIYQPYGVSLTFTPVVLGEGRILLHLSTEVTDIDYTKTVVIQGVPTPGLLTRKNATSVELPSGGSIASAGLLQTLSAQVINGFPGLMDLPILGTLFRSRDYQRQETELMIIVTPYLVQATQRRILAAPGRWICGFERSAGLAARPHQPPLRLTEQS